MPRSHESNEDHAARMQARKAALARAAAAALTRMDTNERSTVPATPSVNPHPASHNRLAPHPRP